MLQKGASLRMHNLLSAVNKKLSHGETLDILPSKGDACRHCVIDSSEVRSCTVSAAHSAQNRVVRESQNLGSFLICAILYCSSLNVLYASQSKLQTQQVG